MEDHQKGTSRLVKMEAMSDLHLEFGPLEYEPKPDTEIVIFAGDIGTKMQGIIWICNIAKNYPDKDFIYVCGNHEFYGTKSMKGLMWSITRHIRQSGLTNVHHLATKKKVIRGIHFFGGTAWTDLSGLSEYNRRIIYEGMNDFKYIGDYRRRGIWALNEWQKKHDHFRNTLHISLKPRNTNVVISHHLPDISCTSSYYRDSSLNGAYASNLLDLFKNKNIKLWIHGHSHSFMDEKIKGVRCYRNPRGYIGYEPAANRFDPKQIELLVTTTTN